MGGMFVICVRYFSYRDYSVGETQNTESVCLMAVIPVGSVAVNTIQQVCVTRSAYRYIARALTQREDYCADSQSEDHYTNTAVTEIFVSLPTAILRTSHLFNPLTL